MSEALPVDPGPENIKIITRASAARARVVAADGGEVRDEKGRAYAATAPALPLQLSALYLAVAIAERSGASNLAAAAAVTVLPAFPP